MLASHKHPTLADLELRFERLRFRLFDRERQSETSVETTHSTPAPESTGGWDNWSDWSQFNQFSNY